MSWQWRCYRRQFRDPLITTHGPWATREGLILRWEPSPGTVHYAEIAPIPWLGSETLAAAMGFCQHACQDDPRTLTVPNTLPATQFALSWLRDPWSDLGWTAPTCILLGRACTAPHRWQPDVTVVKVKIGVDSLPTEQAALASLPTDLVIRLDANGGLSDAEAHNWLEWAALRPQIEFLEQPLPPVQINRMRQLAAHYPTPIALDESLITLEDLAQLDDWPDIVVLKPSLLGSPIALKQYCQGQPVDGVISSALETAIGLAAVQRVGQHLAPWLKHQRAWGLGSPTLFNDNWHQITPDQLWGSLSPGIL
ncbi:MAG: o-succinylbenzoate synthase [Synechococcales cyanobacterium]